MGNNDRIDFKNLTQLVSTATYRLQVITMEFRNILIKRNTVLSVES